MTLMMCIGGTAYFSSFEEALAASGLQECEVKFTEDGRRFVERPFLLILEMRGESDGREVCQG